MSSPGIDKWIAKAPESWAKLAKTKSKNKNFNQWKEKFLEGAERENKPHLKDLTDEQLKKIYTNGYGGTIKTTTTTTTITKPTHVIIKRNAKEYKKSVTPHWSTQTQFVLKLAAQSKPRSKEYNKYVQILMQQGRTRQATTKKIQRTRRQLK